MPRKRIYRNIEEAVHYYIGQWYTHAELNPRVLKTIESRYERALELEAKFKEDIEERFPYWATEENLGLFAYHLDFLTKAYSAYKKKMEINRKTIELQNKAEENRLRKVLTSQKMRNNEL